MDNDTGFTKGSLKANRELDCDHYIGESSELWLGLPSKGIIFHKFKNVLNTIPKENSDITLERIIRCIIQKVPDGRNRVRVYLEIIRTFETENNRLKDRFLYELLYLEHSREVDRLVYRYSDLYGEVHYQAVYFLLQTILSRNALRPRVRPRIFPGNRNEIELLARNGRQFISCNDFEKAISCFSKIIDIQPENVNAWDCKGYCLGEIGHYDEALECYDKAIEIDKSCGAAWYHKGKWLASNGDYMEALYCFDTTLKIGPVTKKLYYNKGYAFERLEEHRAAIECYDKALEFQDDDINIWINKGYNYSRLKEYERALDCYHTALEFDPTNKEIWFITCSLLMEMGRYEQALLSVYKILDLDKDSPEAIELKDKIKVQIYINKRIAITGFENKAKLSFKTISYYDCIFSGLRLLELGKFPEALQFFNQALKINPGNPDPWLFKRQCYIGMNNPIQVNECEKKINLNIFHENARFLYQNREFTIANIFYIKLVAFRPLDPDIWDDIGSCAEALGEYEEAQVCYNYAEKLRKK